MEAFPWWRETSQGALFYGSLPGGYPGGEGDAVWRPHPAGQSRWGVSRGGSGCRHGSARRQNARLFAIGTSLEVDLVGAFLLTLTTVSGKSQKRTLQKWSKGGRAIAAIAAIAISIGGF